MGYSGRASVAVAVAVLTASHAQKVRAEWYNITSSSDGSVYSIDPERVRIIGSKRQVWVKANHSRNRSEQARSSMILMGIDCSASTIRTLAENRYDSFGKTISSFSNPDYGVGYKPITPETIGEDVAQYVCPNDQEGA